MTDREIVELLERTGHLDWPFGKHSPTAIEPTDQYPRRSESAITRAIASWQDFMCECLDPLCAKYHSRHSRADGKLGPASLELMGMPRCGCPDYGPDVAAATGSGSWKGCHGIGNFHACTVYVDKSRMPPFWKSLWDEIWSLTVGCFADIGLAFIVAQEHGANINISFVARYHLPGP